MYQNLHPIPHSKYTHLQTCKILTKNYPFSFKIFLSGRSKTGCKAKLQKAKTNDLMLTKYSNKSKLKLPISMFPLPQAHSYQQTIFLLL